MYPFDYVRPASVADAAAPLAASSGGRALAGGQSLVARDEAAAGAARRAGRPLGHRRPVGNPPDGDAIVIGAMTRHADVAASAEVQAGDPGARRAGRRHRRPAGPQHGHARRRDSPTTTRPPTDPRRCWASARRSTPTSARIAADDFFRGMYETALAADELITAVSFPIPKQGGVRQVRQSGVAFRAGRRVRRADRPVASASRSPAPRGGVPRRSARGRAVGELFRRPPRRASKIDAAGLNADLHASRRVPRASDPGAGGARGRRGAADAAPRTPTRVGGPPTCRFSPAHDSADCFPSIRRRHRRAARRAHDYVADRRLATGVFLALRMRPPAVPRGRGRRRQDRDRQGARRRRSAGSSSACSATRASTSRRRSTSGTTRGR